HLAAAIANYRYRLGEPTILVTVADLLDYLRAAFSPTPTTSFEKRFTELKTVPLLVMDQLDLTNASPWSLEKLRQIINHRYVARLPTVFTSAQEFNNLDPAIRSRLADVRRSHVFFVLAPDYKGGGSGTTRRKVSL